MAATLADHGLAPTVQEPHVTVFTPGFVCSEVHFDDDVHERSLVAQATALRESRPRRTALHVGGVNAFLSCVYLEIEDTSGELLRWRQVLQAHGHEAGRDWYVPHVTVAPFADTRPTAPIVDSMRPLRHATSLVVYPQALELVVLDASDGSRPMQTVASIALS